MAFTPIDLHALKAGTTQPSAPAPIPVAPGPHLADGPAGDFAGNAVRAVAAPLVRAAGAVLNNTVDQTYGRVANAARGKGFTPTHTAERAYQAADAIQQDKEESLAGHVGTFIGNVAPYFVGLGEAAAAAKATELGLGKAVLPKIHAYIAEHLPSLAKNTAIGTAQTGDLKQGAEIGIGGEILSGAGGVMSAAGKGAYKALAIPTSKIEANMIQAYQARTPFFQRIGAVLKGDQNGPVTADETAFAKGLFGREKDIGVQARRVASKLWDGGIKPALERSGTTVNMPQFFADVEKQIIDQTPELSRQKGLLEALSALKEDYAGVEDVPLLKLQEFKSGWAERVPQKAYQGKDIAGMFQNVLNEAAGNARQRIYQELGPEVRRAYIDYGNLQSLAEWGQTAMTGGKFKGGTGGFLNALKDAILTPVATIGGHLIYKTGKGMQFIGPVGAKTLSDLFNEASQR
jgi:hypothetical protein